MNLNNLFLLLIFVTASGYFYFNSSAREQSKEGIQLTAKKYFSGFPLAHDTYNAVSAASDGKIYYILSSQSEEIGGQMYVYDPVTDRTSLVADLTEIRGEKDQKAIPQGKCHVRFYERAGKLYFATHIGYYEMIDGLERLPVNAPEGYELYQGGIFFPTIFRMAILKICSLLPEEKAL